MNLAAFSSVTESSRFSILGVRIDNITLPQAIGRLEEIIRSRPQRAAAVFFVNAHTLNLAAADRSYCQTLNSAELVLADGTGVRWAARYEAFACENLTGTDFVPTMFQETAGRGYSYYLLGADERTIPTAADYARRMFPGWRQAGHRHGYLGDEALASAAIERINERGRTCCW